MTHTLAELRARWNERQIAAVAAVQQGMLVATDGLDTESYRPIRRALQDYAAHQIDGGQGVYAVIALQEVARLDRLFNDDHA